MAATFQDIADNVSIDINQGTTLDAIILNKVYEAHRSMERNNSFEYMTQQRVLSQPLGVSTFTFTPGWKRVKMIRYDYEGTFQYLEQVHPADPGRVEEAPPKYWYLTGASTANLFLTFTEATDLTIIETVTRQTYAPGESDWLTDQGQDLLHYMTMAAMGIPTKDSELITLVAPQIELHLQTTLDLDENLRRGTVRPEIRFGT